MAQGEIDYDDNFKGGDWLTKIILLIFLIDITMVMMNIIIGLAVTDVNEIKKKGNTQWIRWQIRKLIYNNYVRNLCENMIYYNKLFTPNP